VLRLYDAARCPYCARVRIVLAEKQVEYEPVVIDLDGRPAWIYKKNPSGRVPVLEEDDGFVLPESAVIMEYLEELFPEPALLPAAPAARALVRLWINRFDDRLGDVYYAVRRGDADPEQLGAALAILDRGLGKRPFLAGDEYTLADAAYVPWLVRTEPLLGVEVAGFRALTAWLDRLGKRPAVAAELDVVQALPR
jgi:glutathione S-transferase